MNFIKPKRGAAMAMVIMFMTLMLVLGTGLIMAAQYNATHSAAVLKADRYYYAAESAAQLAAQIFLAELGLADSGDALKIEELDIDESVIDVSGYVDGMKAELYNRILAAYASQVKGRVEGREFNGETVELGELFLVDGAVGTREIFGIEHIDSEVIEAENLVTDDGSPIAAAAVVYVANPNFLMTVTSGGRTVSVETSAEEAAVHINTQTATLPGGGGGGGGDPSILYGAFYRGETGGIYGSGDPADKNDKYNVYMSNLHQWLADADAAWNERTLSQDIVIPPSDAPEFPGISAYNAVAAVGSTYINTWDTVVLGSVGVTTRYENLKYIRGENGLQLRGKVELPNLRGVYINGGQVTINGEVSFPIMENFYFPGNMLIEENTKINPMTVNAAGEVVNRNRPSGKCGFYGGSVMTINSNAEINWCKFNIRQIQVNFGAGGRFVTNSIFFSRDWVRLSGRANSDISRTVPQFYMRGYMNVDGNIQNLSGIFITPDDGWIVGGGFNGTANLRGLLVGNYNNWSTGAPIDNPTPSPLSNAAFDLIKSNEYIDVHMEGEGSGSSDIPATEVGSADYTYHYRGLKIREITGETD